MSPAGKCIQILKPIKTHLHETKETSYCTFLLSLAFWSVHEIPQDQIGKKIWKNAESNPDFFWKLIPRSGPAQYVIAMLCGELEHRSMTGTVQTGNKYRDCEQLREALG